MEFYLPSRDECQRITQISDAFYCTTKNIEGQLVEMYDYRLASLSDFQDHNAFELRGLTFVLDRETYTWERHILLNKFFNINQCSGRDLVEVTTKGSGTLLYKGPKDCKEYYDSTAKLTPRKERVIGKEPGWMYDDVKHKRIDRVQNKEDGSVISFVGFKNGNVRAKSKMSFDSEQAVAAQRIYDENDNYLIFIGKLQNRGFTPIFELVGPDNQIVVEYQEEQLILLQIRNKDGSYWCQDDMVGYAKQFNIPCAYDYSEMLGDLRAMMGVNPLDELLELKATVTDPNIEGWIVTFEDGQMAKIKTDKYLQLHGLIGPDAFRENLLVETILSGNIDDVVSALESGPKKDKIVELDEKVSHKFNHMVVEFKELRRKYFHDFKEDKKGFAIKHSKDELFSGVMRSLNVDDVESMAEEKVKEHILKVCNTLGGAKKWVEGL